MMNLLDPDIPLEYLIPSDLPYAESYEQGIPNTSTSIHFTGRSLIVTPSLFDPFFLQFQIFDRNQFKARIKNVKVKVALNGKGLRLKIEIDLYNGCKISLKTLVTSGIPVLRCMIQEADQLIFQNSKSFKIMMIIKNIRNLKNR